MIKISISIIIYTLLFIYASYSQTGINYNTSIDSNSYDCNHIYIGLVSDDSSYSGGSGLILLDTTTYEKYNNARFMGLLAPKYRINDTLYNIIRSKIQYYKLFPHITNIEPPYVLIHLTNKCKIQTFYVLGDNNIYEFLKYITNMGFYGWGDRYKTKAYEQELLKKIKESK